MPQPLKPPRLLLRERKGRAAAWIILDQGKECATGCGAEDRTGAEEALAAYLASKHRPRGGPSDPADYSIADALIRYGEGAQGRVRAPRAIGYAISCLVPFWTGSVDSISKTTCAAYVTHRRAMGVKDGTIIRELGVLAAAVNALADDRIISRAPTVTKPSAPPPRDRFLTHEEAARLIEAAEGSPRAPHIATFIRFGLATGTRASAILALRWTPSTVGGWIDLESGLIYRRGLGERETTKRRPPLRIAADLRPYLEDAKKRTRTHLIEDAKGNPVIGVKTAFARACRVADLKGVSPHVLRHTCATWALQGGASIFEVAGVLGDTIEMIERVYGHHSPDHLRAAVDAAAGFLRPKP